MLHEDAKGGSAAASLARLVAELEGCGAGLDGAHAAAILQRVPLDWHDIEPYVAESAQGYTRRSVLRTDAFELLVMTWRAGQASTPHDHAGAHCAMKVLRGRVSETRFRLACDGLVDAAETVLVRDGEVTFDRGTLIHRLGSALAPGELLVTLHVYCPPLPELRRYMARASGAEPLPVFQRRPNPDTPRVVIVGGGFSGTMVAAQLFARAQAARLHVVLVERHSAVGEGPAYRTVDARHLLNVPAGKMSAWPDRPRHFLDWARARQPQIGPEDFLPRSLYAEYVKASLAEAAAAAGAGVSAEIRQDDVQEIRPRPGGYHVRTRSGERLDAAAVVLATGHRPPDDPLGQRWRGPRARLIADPWGSLALTAIRPDAPVVLLGTGLTAIDALLTLTREPRSAPIIAISRRGLLPAAHTAAALTPADPLTWLTPLLRAPGGPTTRGLLREVRAAVADARASGRDWRSILDGLRPFIHVIWAGLPRREAQRWLRHVRPFWEVHRHRTAPSIAQTISRQLEDGSFRVLAGRVLSADADSSGVTLEIRPRGAVASQALRTAWVINCTGPGVDARTRTEPAIASLVAAGVLEPDPLGLGVVARSASEPGSCREPARLDVLMVGTLCKPRLWESTAVPELRAQAAQAASDVLAHLAKRSRELFAIAAEAEPALYEPPEPSRVAALR